jgi:P27 family predicted phage terminase small subunit
MAGRRPKPTALKELTGNPGKRALNKNEPKPGGVPTCPAALDATGKREWSRVSRELIAVGLLTSVDRAMLAAYCDSWSRWSQATKELQALRVAKGKSVLVVGTKTGYPMQNPLIGIINTAADQMRKFGVELGLSPSSRTRLAVEPAGDQKDPFAEFMREIGGDEVSGSIDDEAREIYTASADRGTVDLEVGTVSD